MAVDGATNVYVADRGNNTIRRMTPVGEVTTLAGLAGGVGSVDGLASAARFNTPQGLAVDGAGNVYVADSWNSTIRKVSLEGIVTTLAGRAGYDDNVDGVGSAARFSDPEGMAVDGATNVYVADWSSQTIRKVATSGAVVTIAGVAWRYGTNDGPGNVAQFANPSDVAVDSATNVYVADSSNNTIRKVSPGGVVTTLAGLGGSSGSTDGTGSAARFNDPEGVAVDSATNVYVADMGNQTIRKVTPGGVVTTLAGRAWTSGSADGTNNTASFYNPSGMAVDSSGNLYVAETGNWTIRKVTPGGVVTTVGGQAGNQGSVDGTGSTARFYGPIGVAMDSAGNLYIADTGNNTIRRGSPACADRPVIDAASGPVGVSRQLDISPLTAVAWRWRQVRQPAGSTAQLSSTTARNPTFTPDVADLYVFELQATNAAGQIAISRVSLTGLPVVSRPLFVPGSLRSINNGQFQFTLAGVAGSNYEIQVTSDLRNWVVWRSILMTNATLDLLDTSTNLQRRFYRARLAQ
jgi:sugar lactone lactonase YvrE